MSSTRRLRLNALFTTGTSITVPSLVGVNSITTANLSALYTTAGNIRLQDVTVGNAIYMNTNSVLSLNTGSTNDVYITSNNGPEIFSYNGGILATANGSNAVVYFDYVYGNVSINSTTAPLASLDVKGTISNVKTITIDNITRSPYFTNASNAAAYFSSTGSYQLVLYNHSDGLRNRVCGINVSENTATWGRSTMYMAGRDHVFYIGATTGSSVAARGTEVMRIKSSGVGVGTSNPLYRLHVLHNDTALPSLIAHTLNNQNHTLRIKDDGYALSLTANPGAGALTNIYGYNTMLMQLRDSTNVGGGALLMLTTGSIFNSAKVYKNFPNDVFILSSKHDSHIGHLGFGCSSTATNNWFIKNETSLMSINNGNMESSSTAIIQMFRSTAGNSTGVSMGNYTTSISVGNVSSWTSGSLQASSFKSLSGSFSVSTIGTYNITTGAMGYVGSLSCYLTSISNGSWSARADVIMPNSATLRGNVSNVQTSQFSGNAIVATLEPFGGSNSNATVADSPANAVRVNVTTLSSATTLYWSLTMYAELI